MSQSHTIFDYAQQFIPGGVSSANRLVDPNISFTRAEGAYIYDEDGKQVFDSGDDFERITARALGQFFNSDNDEANSGDKRSDNKGPEPEGVVVGEHNGKTYAFIGLERVGGIMIYDVSNPYAPVFQDYVNTRNFSSSFDFVNLADVKRAGPLGPEGLAFVPAKDSPTGKPLLMVAYEVSGTVKVFELVE